MKRFKLVAVILAACMFASMLTACTEQATDTETTKSIDEPVDVEPTEPAEPAIDTSLYQEGSYFDIKNDNESEAAKSYFYARQMAEIVHAENPDYYFVFSNVSGVGRLRCGTVDYGFWNEYYMAKDGTDMCEVASSLGHIHSYEDFMKLPMSIYMDGPIKGERVVYPIYDSVEDGTYNAALMAVSIDGTKAVIAITDPVIISAEEFYNLKPGDRVTVTDSDPHYLYDLTISKDFDPYDPEYSCDIDRAYPTENMKYTFKYCVFRFYQMEDGNFVLGLGRHGQTDAGMNARMAIVDIAPDCEIIDESTTVDFNPLITPTPYGYSDGINNLTKSYFFYLYTALDTGINHPYIYNDWISMGTYMEPCVIKDNKIIEMTVPFTYYW